jgi:hypothetical protein
MLDSTPGVWFGPTRHELKVLAFSFMGKLVVAHRLNRTQKMVGLERVYLFLKLHPRLTLRTEENLSINRALRVSRSKTGVFFESLEGNMTEFVLMYDLELSRRLCIIKSSRAISRVKWFKHEETNVSRSISALVLRVLNF